MRFMLEAAGIEAEGASGAIKLQGLALAWARVLRTGSTMTNPLCPRPWRNWTAC